MSLKVKRETERMFKMTCCFSSTKFQNIIHATEAIKSETFGSGYIKKLTFTIYGKKCLKKIWKEAFLDTSGF